jgi:hypothetical protein
MRPTHKNRNRNRHRSGGGGGGGGGGGNPLSRVYESNGPDVKVRGTAQTIADKYLQLGRDAQSSGDIVMAESYFQHAEHYLRIVFAAQAYNQQQQQQFRRPDDEFDEDDDQDQPEAAVEARGGSQPAAEADGLGDQPMIDGAPERPAQQGQQFRPPREQRDFGREGREQGQGGRDRFRPRWQDRRQDNQQQPQGQQGQAPRAEEQPRTESPPPAPAADAGRWEAPSFLRRPAAAPAAPEPSAAEPAAAQPAPKRRYERRPRKEAETPSPADGE